MTNNFTLPTFSYGKSQGSAPGNAYLACLIDPANNIARYPDEYSNQTALYASRSFYDVYGNYAATSLPADVGKFAFYIRPVVGITPYTYQTSQVQNYNPAMPWPNLGNFNVGGNFMYYGDPNQSALVGPGPNQDTGLVREIRPVAMSAWFQFTAPSMTIGGYVASALTDGNPGNWVHDNSVAPIAGCPLEEYRALSALPNSYAGKITEGTYSFYKPYDADDVVFRNAHAPDSSSNSDYGIHHNFPAIVISGHVMSTGATFSGPVGRIQVDILFEYVTLSRLVESIPSPVDVQQIWNARQALQGFKTCMANDDHPKFIQKVLQFAKHILGSIAPVLGATVGGMIGGPTASAVGGSVGKFVQNKLTSVPRALPPPMKKKAKPRPKKNKVKVIKA